MRLGLVQEDVGVAGLVRVAGTAVADGLDVLADLRRVVVDVPVGELPVDRQRDVLPALEHGPDLEALVEARRGVRAGVVDVEDRAPDGAREPLLGGAGEGACAGRDQELRVVLVVEAVQPRQDEVGRADERGHGAHGRGHILGCRRLRCRVGLAHVASCPAGRSPPMVSHPGGDATPAWGTMGLVDGTGELMRHDLEVWPPDEGAGRPSEAGVTRRGFLVGAGFAAAVVVVGGIAWRIAPWRDWLGAAGDKLGVDLPGASGARPRLHPALPLRRRAGRLQHRLAAGDGAGRSSPRLLRAARTQRRSADGIRGSRGDGGTRGASRRRTPWSASTAATPTGTRASPVRTV